MERLSAALNSLKGAIYRINSAVAAVADLKIAGIRNDHLKAIGILLEQQHCLLAEKMDWLERARQSVQDEESELPF